MSVLGKLRQEDHEFQVRPELIKRFCMSQIGKKGEEERMWEAERKGGRGEGGGEGRKGEKRRKTKLQSQ